MTIECKPEIVFEDEIYYVIVTTTWNGIFFSKQKFMAKSFTDAFILVQQLPSEILAAYQRSLESALDSKRFL